VPLNAPNAAFATSVVVLHERPDGQVDPALDRTIMFANPEDAAEYLDFDSWSTPAWKISPATDAPFCRCPHWASTKASTHSTAPRPGGVDGRGHPAAVPGRLDPAVRS
jgi:hypothetical protein